MQEKINLFKLGSEYVLTLPRGKRLEKGDSSIGMFNSHSKVSSVREEDYFDARIYYLEDGSCLANPIKIVGFESDIAPELLTKIKELKEVPLYIEIVENQIVRESGKIKIIY
jgi:hypothetical protein